MWPSHAMFEVEFLEKPKPQTYVDPCARASSKANKN